MNDTVYMFLAWIIVLLFCGLITLVHLWRVNRLAGRRGISWGVACDQRIYTTKFSPEECINRLRSQEPRDRWRVEIESAHGEHQLAFYPGFSVRVRGHYQLRIKSDEATHLYLKSMWNDRMTDIDLDSFFIPKLDCTPID